jgi:hypothetical protein
MCMSMAIKERIFSRWDAVDDAVQRMLMNEFKVKHKGCYTEKDLLTFLEARLPKASKKVANG